jgi:hypothetical protein
MSSSTRLTYRRLMDGLTVTSVVSDIVGHLGPGEPSSRPRIRIHTTCVELNICLAEAL